MYKQSNKKHMKHNVVIKNKKFFEDLEKGVVVCVLQYRFKIKGDSIPIRVGLVSSPKNQLFPGYNVAGKTTEVKGIARCNKEDDTFDLTIGRRLAESRAKINLYKQVRKTYAALEANVQKALDSLSQATKSAEEACSKQVYNLNANLENV